MALINLNTKIYYTQELQYLPIYNIYHICIDTKIAIFSSVKLII